MVGIGGNGRDGGVEKRRILGEDFLLIFLSITLYFNFESYIMLILEIISVFSLLAFQFSTYNFK